MRPLLLRRMQRITLALTIPAIFLWYFDFMFRSDVLHFLTNIGPASQTIRAGDRPDGNGVLPIWTRTIAGDVVYISDLLAILSRPQMLFRSCIH